MQKNKIYLEQALAYSGFRRILPSVELRLYVQCYWQIKTQLPLPSPSTELMHPDGGLGMILNFGDPMYYENNIIQNCGFMDGTHTKTRRMTMSGSIDAIGIRFNPGGAHWFYSVPLSEIGNLTVDLNDLALEHFIELCHEERETNPKGDILKYVNKLLLKKFIPEVNHDGMSETLLKRIQATKGLSPISDSVKDIGRSYRQIERLFKNDLGMTPKQYARLVRVENARYLLKKRNKNQSFTEIGEKSGFYDQAHFIREFNSIIGLTPMAYLNFK